MSLLTVSGKRELKRLGGAINRLEQRIIPVATSQAINKTLPTLRTVATAKIKQETNLAVGKIRKALIITKSNKRTLSGKLDSRTGRATNLADFVTASQLKSQPRLSKTKRRSGKAKGSYRSQGVKSKAWGSTKVYDGTFIGRGKASGKKLVFARTGAGRNSKLKAIRGPSIRQTFIKANVQSALRRKVSTQFDIEFKRAFANEMRKSTKAR